MLLSTWRQRQPQMHSSSHATKFWCYVFCIALKRVCISIDILSWLRSFVALSPAPQKPFSEGDTAFCPLVGLYGGRPDVFTPSSLGAQIFLIPIRSIACVCCLFFKFFFIMITLYDCPPGNDLAPQDFKEASNILLGLATQG